MIFIENLSNEGPNLVLFHGWAFDSSIWQSLSKRLNNKFNLYLVDLPGHGRSPFMDYELFKAEILEQLPAQFWLLGWSLGSLVANNLALHVPDRVQGIINIAASPRFLYDETWPGIKIEVFTSFLANLQKNPQKVRAQFVNLQIQPRRATQTYLNRATQTYPSRAREQADQLITPENIIISGLNWGMEFLQSSDFRHNLLNLSCPKNYILGRYDTIIPIKVTEHIKDLDPSVKIFICENSAHMPFLSETAYVAEIIEDLILLHNNLFNS
jgi:pimeloyl-[acyl-carrier protein] methyl ester esterase